MSSACSQKKQVLAYEVISPTGATVTVFATNNGAAKNRGARRLGITKDKVKSCRRRPDLDYLAPETDPKDSRVPIDTQLIEQQHPGMRLCSKCRVLQPLAAFYVLDARGKGRECRSCRAKRWQSMPPDKRVQQLISTAKHRARLKNIPFDLTVADIKIPELCPVLGIPLCFSTIENRHQSPSLDRIVPELGYVRGNIIVVSWLANDIRRNFKPTDILAVGKFYSEMERTGLRPDDC